MIQRIQSLFIIISIALMAFLLVSPLAEILTTENSMSFFANGMESAGETVMKTLPMFILILSILILDGAAFMGFKKRMLQIRLLTFSMVLKLGSYGLGAFYILQYKNEMGFEFIPKYAMSFPLIGFILSLLAIRAIGKDEALVKSLDRIR